MWSARGRVDGAILRVRGGREGVGCAAALACARCLCVMCALAWRRRAQIATQINTRPQAAGKQAGGGAILARLLSRDRESAAHLSCPGLLLHRPIPHSHETVRRGALVLYTFIFSNPPAALENSRNWLRALFTLVLWSPYKNLPCALDFNKMPARRESSMRNSIFACNDNNTQTLKLDQSNQAV